MDGLFFLSDMPEIVLLEGGFFTPSDHAYHFQVTDRQGNVRLVTGAGGTVEQAVKKAGFKLDKNESEMSTLIIAVCPAMDVIVSI